MNVIGNLIDASSSTWIVDLVDQIRLMFVRRKTISVFRAKNPRTILSRNSSLFYVILRSPNDDHIITRFPGTATVSHTYLEPPTRERDSARLWDRTIPRICIFSPYYTPTCLSGNERFEELYAVTLFVKHLYNISI